MDTYLLNAIRESEILSTRKLFVPGSRILELGGGDGYQARLIADGGHDVASIDIACRTKRQALQFPVQDYDGYTIPFPNGSFDAVFSSNVLEHIPHLPRIFNEMRRVLRPAGMAIHLLPTPAWRAWTTLTHFPNALSVLPNRLGSLIAPPPSVPSAAARSDDASDSLAARRHPVTRFLGLEPHGEYPNAIAELYFFSRRRWEREFRANRFRVLSHAPSGLFYTGHLLAKSLSISRRALLAGPLGSACHVFVTAPSENQE